MNGPDSESDGRVFVPELYDERYALPNGTSVVRRTGGAFRHGVVVRKRGQLFLAPDIFKCKMESKTWNSGNCLGSMGRSLFFSIHSRR